MREIVIFIGASTTLLPIKGDIKETGCIDGGTVLKPIKGWRQ